jgi:hypothetical protein
MRAIHRNIGLGAALAACAALACAAAQAQTTSETGMAKITPAAARTGPHVVKLVNAGKSAISAVYVAAPGSLNWSDDLLGKQVAGAGKTVTLKVQDPAGACVFDIQFLMSSGDAVDRTGVNVCDQDTYTFTP